MVRSSSLSMSWTRFCSDGECDAIERTAIVAKQLPMRKDVSSAISMDFDDSGSITIFTYHIDVL